jgi:ATP-dependent exoDNAse (exonuclease V) beta subunit
LAIVLPTGKFRVDSLAASLSAASDELANIPGFERISAAELMSERAFSPAVSDIQQAPAPERPARPRVTLATVGVTALSDFAICARRFELNHLFGIAEPRLGPGSLRSTHEDPRALGSAAHRVLEAFPSERWGTPIEAAEIEAALLREGLDADSESSAVTARGIAAFLQGRYARAIRADGSRIRRELSIEIPFRRDVTTTEASLERASKSRGRRVPAGQLELFALRPRTDAPDPELMGATVVLKATLDLVIERADGSVDIIDYKRSRGGDAERYAFQLAAYREVARRSFGKEQIRTGLVHLLGDDSEPDWQTPPQFDFFELGTRLVEARFLNRWPGVTESACRKAQCGFVTACHSRRSDERGTAP